MVQVQIAVVVSVSGGDIHGLGRQPLVVGDGDVGKVDVTGIGDDVAPEHRLTRRNGRADGQVGILAVGHLFNPQ